MLGLSLAKRAALVALCLVAALCPAAATPSLVVDVDTGEILLQEQATANWYPASLTKLMTTYVALQAVRAGRLTMDTPLVVSLRAARAPPSKMGFRPGVQVTLDNALKMLMVKSPNDVAVTVAEGVSGSVEAFAGEMNSAAQNLGMHESHFVNPNGLANPGHVSSARDMAMLGRALLREFPEHKNLFGIGALQLGNQIILNHNGLIGRYPGADGMKTGFTCPAGFNVVASATQGGRRLIVVVLGANSAKERSSQAAALFDRGFATGAGGQGDLQSLSSPGVGPAPDMRGDICRRRSASALANAEDEDRSSPIAAIFGKNSIFAAMFGGGGGGGNIYNQPVSFDPVPVFIGPKPGWSGTALAARTPVKAIVAAPPISASAYSPENIEAALPAQSAASGQESSAPMALQGAVHGTDAIAGKGSAAPDSVAKATSADVKIAKLKSAELNKKTSAKALSASQKAKKPCEGSACPPALK